MICLPCQIYEWKINSRWSIAFQDRTIEFFFPQRGKNYLIDLLIFKRRYHLSFCWWCGTMCDKANSLFSYVRVRKFANKQSVYQENRIFIYFLRLILNKYFSWRIVCFWQWTKNAGWKLKVLILFQYSNTKNLWECAIGRLEMTTHTWLQMSNRLHILIISIIVESTDNIVWCCKWQFSVQLCIH